MRWVVSFFDDLQSLTCVTILNEMSRVPKIIRDVSGLLALSPIISAILLVVGQGRSGLFDVLLLSVIYAPVFAILWGILFLWEYDWARDTSVVRILKLICTFVVFGISFYFLYLTDFTLHPHNFISPNFIR
jgi:hypothetical protein